MKKFNFRLQKVLEVRKLKEDQRARELAALKQELIKAQSLLELLRQENIRITAYLQSHHLVVGSKLDMGQLHNCCNYMDGLKSKMASQVKEIKDCVAKVERKRIELIEASKEKKVMEKLKDQKYEEFLKDVEIWERNILDEVGTLGFNQKTVKK